MNHGKLFLLQNIIGLPLFQYNEANAIIRLCNTVYLNCLTCWTSKSRDCLHCFKHWQLFTFRFILFGNIANRE